MGSWQHGIVSSSSVAGQAMYALLLRSWLRHTIEETSAQGFIKTLRKGKE